MPRSCAVSLLLLTCFCPILSGQCEPSASVRPILEKLQAQDLWKTGKSSERNKILEHGLADNPDDYFLLRRKLQSEESPAGSQTGEWDAGLKWAKAQRDRYPDRPVYTLIYAKALAGTNTPETIRLMQALEKDHPEISRAHLDLISATEIGKFKDKARNQSDVQAFFKACPAPLESSALQILANSGTQELMIKVAAAVRKRLETEIDRPFSRNHWTALWNLEFKSHPPGEHPAVRKQVGVDLANLDTRGPHDVEWLIFLREGYESAGNHAAAEKISDQIVTDYAASEQAKKVIQDRWRKQHPFPRSKDERAAYDRLSLIAAEEWHRRWPDDSLILAQMFGALSRLPDTAPKQIEAVADELLTLYRKNPNWYGFPPMEFGVADAFIKHRIHLDQVPGLVEAAYQASLNRNARSLRDDRYPDDLHSDFEDSDLSLKLDRARILISYYAAVNQPEKVDNIVAELATVNPSKSYLKSSLMSCRAKAAEVQGRKLDALMLYRAAVEARGGAPVPPIAENTPEQNLERLWKELGGTSASYSLFMEKPKASSATDSRWERPKNPLPSFVVSDLRGKTWKLANLEGKAVLINIWATWCGPCREEHPEFQKLYDKLKARPEVAVLSFNVDDEVAKVEPYMQENKYTFPVLLGKEVVDQVVPALAIPRNWFVNTKGKLEWEQVGYGVDPNWSQTMENKLIEVLKSVL